MDPLTLIASVASIAPTILKWIGAGKDVQAVADKAADIAKVVTGVDTTDAAVEALKADPALAAQYNQALIDQETQFENLYVSDKQNARARDIVLAATPSGNVRANWLVGVAILVVVCILGAVIGYSDINEFAKGVLTTILGVFLQNLNNIYAFEFGTTRRSRDKSDVLDAVKSSIQDRS